MSEKGRSLEGMLRVQSLVTRGGVPHVLPGARKPAMITLLGRNLIRQKLTTIQDLISSKWQVRSRGLGRECALRLRPDKCQRVSTNGREVRLILTCPWPLAVLLLRGLDHHV